MLLEILQKKKRIVKKMNWRKRKYVPYINLLELLRCFGRKLKRISLRLRSDREMFWHDD